MYNITANTANSLAYGEVDKSLIHIYERIHKNAKAGKFSIELFADGLSKPQFNRLMTLGFDVSCSNKGVFTIAW